MEEDDFSKYDVPKDPLLAMAQSQIRTDLSSRHYPFENLWDFVACAPDSIEQGKSSRSLFKNKATQTYISVEASLIN
jgi:hypothetical protein